jgi:hypothetical protein
MTVRIIACLVLVGVGGFALYTVSAKPEHPYSEEPLDQAIGIPKVGTRIMRGGIGLLFIGFGLVGILRALKIFSE